MHNATENKNPSSDGMDITTSRKSHEVEEPAHDLKRLLVQYEIA